MKNNTIRSLYAMFVTATKTIGREEAWSFVTTHLDPVEVKALEEYRDKMEKHEWKHIPFLHL